MNELGVAEYYNQSYGVPRHAGSGTLIADILFTSSTVNRTRKIQVVKNPVVLEQSKFSRFAPLTEHTYPSLMSADVASQCTAPTRIPSESSSVLLIFCGVLQPTNKAHAATPAMKCENGRFVAERRMSMMFNAEFSRLH
jgi:hypothetical protein